MSSQMILDFTTTATRRPDILRRTYQSFKDNLRGVDMKQCRLFINVDPVGPGTTADVIAVAAEFFGHVTSNSPPVAGFPMAVKWCFKQPTEKLTFHLEDDWELIEPVEYQDFEDAAFLSGNRLVVNLRAHQFRKDITRLFLSPGLWLSTDLRKQIADKMNAVENPEMQLWSLSDNMRIGCYWPDHVVLRDIGREWLAQSGLRKNIHREKGVNPWTHWVQA